MIGQNIVLIVRRSLINEELLLMGRDLGEIQECWDKCSGCTYFRFGPKSKYDLTQVGTCNYQGIKDCVKEEDSNG